METNLTKYILEKFLRDHFLSKKDMAEKTGMSYRMLLRVFSGACSKRDIRHIMDKLVAYCTKEKIPLDDAIQGFCR